MKTTILIKCNTCDYSYLYTFEVGKPPEYNKTCPKCGEIMSRVFGNVNVKNEDDIDKTVSYATQTMLYAKNFSEKDKTVF